MHFSRDQKLPVELSGCLKMDWKLQKIAKTIDCLFKMAKIKDLEIKKTLLEVTQNWRMAQEKFEKK